MASGDKLRQSRVKSYGPSILLENYDLCALCVH